MIPGQPTTSSSPNRYTSFVFLRSRFLLTNQEYHYARSFSKLFDAIASIGGLIPIILVLFLWLHYYALYHFEMVFLKKMHGDYKTNDYGIGYFFSNLLYSGFSSAGMNPSWDKTKEFHEKHRKVN